MAYFVEVAPSGAQMLRDFSKRELRETKAKWEPEGYQFRPVHFTAAHRWVKLGGLHSTDLWTDSEGRIRRAGIGC